jgi:hypothetical protein
MIGRRSFRVARVIILFLGSFTVLSYFCTGSYIGGRITFFRIFFISRYGWKIFGS